MLSGLDTITIISIIGAILAAFVPIITWFFRKERRFQLDIVIDKAVFVVNQIAGTEKSILVTIDGNPASEQVIWMTGWIVNSGNFDISSRMIEHPLTLRTTDSAQWLRGKIVHCSENVECDCEVLGRKEMQFTWAFLRSGEYIRFEALFECPSGEIEEDWDIDAIVEKLSPFSRIENVRTESIFSLSEIGERYNPTKPRKSFLVPKSIVTLVFILYFAFIGMGNYFPFDLNYLYGDGFLKAYPVLTKSENGKTMELQFSMNKEGEVRATGNLNEGERKEYFFENQKDNFRQKHTSRTCICAETFSPYSDFGFSLCYLCCFLLVNSLYVVSEIIFQKLAKEEGRISTFCNTEIAK